MSYRRELEKYRDLDEDEILGALTEEELRTLENELDELDPDVSSRKGEHWSWGHIVSQELVEGAVWWPQGEGQVGLSGSNQSLSPYMTVHWNDVALVGLFLKCCITHDSPEK